MLSALQYVLKWFFVGVVFLSVNSDGLWAHGDKKDNGIQAR